MAGAVSLPVAAATVMGAGVGNAAPTGHPQGIFEPAAAASGSAVVLGSTRAAPEPAWSTRIGNWEPHAAIYNLHPGNMRRWRTAMARASSGLGTAHLSTLVDSITYGAADSGASLPKWRNSWPGRVRRVLDSTLGQPSGTGIAVPFDILFSRPTDDPRFSCGAGTTPYATGATGVSGIGWGPLNVGCVKIDNSAGGTGWLQFAPAAAFDRAVIYLFADDAGSGLASIKVDGIVVGTVSIAPVAAGGTLTRRAGYATHQIIVDVTGLGLAAHSIRVTAPTTSPAFVWGIEAGTGKGVRVSNLGRSSTDVASNLAVSDANNRFGLPVVFDAVRADLAVLLLIMNDWQNGSPTADFKANVRTCVRRQKLVGDVLLIPAAQPNYARLKIASGSAGYLAMVTALYELADEEDVPLLDLPYRWKDYPTAQALRMVTDPLHPNDLGLEDIARAVIATITG